MIRRIRSVGRFCLVLAVALFPEQATARACNAYGLPAALERGVNIAHWMEKLDVPEPSPDVLREIRRRGITAVRLPVNGALLMPVFSDVATRLKMVRRLDSALERLRQSGFVVTLDMHPDRRFAELHSRDPHTALRHLGALWVKLAHRYRALPSAFLSFELLNEPVVDSALWRQQARTLITMLRPFAADRWLVVGAGDAQRIEALEQWRPFHDKRIIYAVHFYDPMVFTHQGLSWEPDNPLRLLRGVPFPVDLDTVALQAVLTGLERSGNSHYAAQFRHKLVAPWGESRVREAFDRLERWQQRFKRPVVINEFGVLRDHAPHADRVAWLALVAAQARRICAGWAVWELDQGFGITDAYGNVDGALLDALMPQP